MTAQERRHKRVQQEGSVDEVIQALSEREPRVQRARARYEIAKRFLVVVSSLCAIVAVGLLIYLAASANAGAEAIQDCTTPGGECYQRSQEQTGKAVAQIVDAQRTIASEGSAPARENLRLTTQNAQNLQVILAILDREYPEAAAAVRAELSKEGK